MDNRLTKLLVVDDNSNTLTTLPALIKNILPDAQVFIASSSQQACELATAENPDLVIINIKMPEMSAFEVCARLKDDEKLCVIPVIFIAQRNVDQEKRMKALACGAEAFLLEPIDEIELTALVRAMFKIKDANILKRDANSTLATAVEERTRELKDSNSKTLQIFEDSKSEQSLINAIFDSIPGYLYVYDENGRLIKWNKKHETMTGYSSEEMAQMTLDKWFDQEDIVRVNAAVQDVFTKGFGDVEARLILKNGERMWIRSSGAPLVLDGQRYFTGIGLDITNQKEVRDNLRESEEKYRSLFETMSQGVVYQAPNGEIIAANPAAQRILGMSMDQMRGVTTMDPRWEAIAEDGSKVKGTEFPVMVALRTGKPVGPLTMAVFQPEINDHIWLSITATPVFKPGATTPYQAYTLFQDITAEHNAQQNYQLLFSEMLDAYSLHEIICDDQGQPIDYRFLAVNPAFENMTGLMSDDIIGKTVLEIFPNTEPYWIALYGKVALTGEPAQFENYSVSMDKHFNVSAYQTKPKQFACTFTDITKRVLSQKEAKENLSRLQGLLENSPSQIMIVDKNGICVEASSCLSKIIAMPQNGPQGKEIHQFLPPEMAEMIMRDIPLVLGENRILEDIYAIEVRGEKRFFECRVFPISAMDRSEKLVGYIGVEVTKRLKAELALKESEERYSSYIQNAPDGIIILNERGQFIEVNEAATRISGYSKEELLAMSIMSVLNENMKDYGIRLFTDLIEFGSTRGEVKYNHRNGSVRWGKIAAVRLSQIRFLAFMSDITEQKEADENLLYTSMHDQLTGLYNRSYFNAEAERLNHAEHLPLSVIIGDINGLKLINDSFGRDTGDTILIEAAKVIRDCCRTGDVLAKTSGDEFSILLPKTSYEAAIAIISKIQSACSEHRITTANESYQISISFGAGTKETLIDNMMDVYIAAEADMNQHKLLEKRSTQSSVIASIQATMLEKSHETEAHSERLVKSAINVGMHMGLSQTDLDHLELLATLHDIGKIGISEQILNKPGSLTDSEWLEMKKHPEIGYRIALSTASLAPIADYILSHHERWDGQGYPQNLAGTAIPLLSRILSVVDAYDAMTQDRVYRKAMSHEKAIEEISKNAGTQFDPQIVEVFCDKAFHH